MLSKFVGLHFLKNGLRGHLSPQRVFGSESASHHVRIYYVLVCVSAKTGSDGGAKHSSEMFPANFTFSEILKNFPNF